MVKATETHSDEYTPDADEDYNPDGSVPGNEDGVDYEDGDGFSFSMKDEKASSGFPLIPEGTYGAHIEKLDYKLSKTSGNPMWAIQWAFDEPEELVKKNRKVFSFVMFNTEQRGRAKMFLKNIGREDLAEAEDFNPKKVAASQVLIGVRGRLKIKTGKGQNDEPQSNVADVLKPHAAMASAL
jgi:hypothetical protein